MRAGSRYADRIRGLAAEGVKPAEIARRLGCSDSNVSQVLSRVYDPAPRMADAVGIARFRPRPASDLCQRPDRRKGFAPCGEPKMQTPCGERLGVCAYHYETTKPLGGMKL
jgi:hypothetical protein